MEKPRSTSPRRLWVMTFRSWSASAGARREGSWNETV
jgi:hypothetical protein